MSQHYKKDGSLDMRYSSSKAYVAANSSSASTGGNSGRSSYTTPSYSQPAPTPSYTPPAPAPRISSSNYSAPSPSYSSGSDLHHKKDGSLDMRYSSSKVAAASVPSEPPRVSQGSSTDNGYHYKKDGSMDMRYASSKEAVASASAQAASGDFHYKKDGSLDMRYSTSKLTGVTENGAEPADEQHYKKDGSLDMRFKSSRDATHESSGLYSIKPSESLHRKKDGTLDMRYKSSKDAMAKQEAEQFNAYAREEYWENLMREAAIQRMWERQKEETVAIPRKQEYIPREHLTAIREQLTALVRDDSATVYLDGAVQIPYHDLDFSRTGKKHLGSGAFGEVYLGYWSANHKNVAVKQLRPEAQPTRKEKQLFEREIAILAQLGDHPNLVAFYGYSPDPLCIVMEYVELGNLHYLLHKCEDKKVELKVTDGRIKKNIIIGVVDGMTALHEAGIVHGDLKPQNILITKDYTAKIADFGLANLRGKAASTVQTMRHELEAIVGGTGPYMAPERLDFSQPNFSCDVYAFGVILNELTTEEEPYSDQYANFVGHDPFAIARYAQQGSRPRMRGNASADVTALVKECWNGKANNRPSFDRIQQTVRVDRFKMPNGPGLN